MSVETRRIELAADFMCDTIADLNPRETLSNNVAIRQVEIAATAIGQLVAWPTYKYKWQGPVKWKQEPEREDK